MRERFPDYRVFINVHQTFLGDRTPSNRHGQGRLRLNRKNGYRYVLNVKGRRSWTMLCGWRLLGGGGVQCRGPYRPNFNPAAVHVLALTLSIYMAVVISTSV
ncbi:hypothetical protein J6590_009233 [Homalodisca vitripennis]|nr:hypothetical protein J6590_009233 [Homalodisca vitripennis]